MHWLFEKYNNFIEHTDITNRDYRMKFISDNSNFNLSKLNDCNSLLDWDVISPHYLCCYDLIEIHKSIDENLIKSDLINSNFLYVETNSKNNIIIVPTNLFVKNWEDFISANQGMGSIILSIDFKYCMEFTDDYKYILHSNFKVV